MENSKNYSEVARDEERKFNSQMLKEFKELAETQTKQFENNPTNQSKEQMPLGDKITYAFCLLGALYFIGRFIAGVGFNV